MNHFSILDDIKKNEELYFDWTLIKYCNFSCYYCFPRAHSPKRSPFENELDVNMVNQAFGALKRPVHVNLTGGEPMMHPRFFELISRLTSDFGVSIYTNLTGDVDRMLDSCNTNNLRTIYASLHLEEREKRGKSFSSFIEKVIQVHRVGVDIRVIYVCLPSNLGRLKEICEKTSEAGICIEARPFRGFLRGKVYPESFRPEEVALMDPWLHAKDRLLLKLGRNFFGQTCSFGCKYFTMDSVGDVYRCYSYKHLDVPKDGSLGNLFNGTFQPKRRPETCWARTCICPYHGIFGVAANKLIKKLN